MLLNLLKVYLVMTSQQITSFMVMHRSHTKFYGAPQQKAFRLYCNKFLSIWKIPIGSSGNKPLKDKVMRDCEYPAGIGPL